MNKFTTEKFPVNTNYLIIIIIVIMSIFCYKFSKRNEILELKVEIQNRKIKELEKKVESIESDIDY